MGFPSVPAHLRALVPQYQLAGTRIIATLVNLLNTAMVNMTAAQQTAAGTLFYVVGTVTHITCCNLPRVAEHARKMIVDNVLNANQQAAFFRELDAAINDRQLLRDWHACLSPGDPRFELNIQHEAFLNVLKEVRRIVRGWPA